MPRYFLRLFAKDDNFAEYADYCIGESKMRTYVDMFAKFRLLKQDEDGKIKPLRKNDVSDLSVGEVLYEIEERSVPFEFKSAAVHFEEDVLYYGKGGLYTSYDKKKLPEMLVYYEKKGCSVATLGELVNV